MNNFTNKDKAIAHVKYGFLHSSWRPLRLLLKAIFVSKDHSVLTEWTKFADHLVKEHGWDQAVKVLKDLHSRTNQSAAGQAVKKGPYGGMWFNTNYLGLPSCLPVLARTVMTDPVAATTVTAIVRIMRCKPNYDVSTIEADYQGVSPINWMGDFDKFCQTHLPHLSTEPDYWHTTTKAGPNGPAAIVTSGIDSLAITNEPALEILFKQACVQFGRNDLLQAFDEFSSCALSGLFEVKMPKTLTNAKLAYLSDKAGKTRVVYILNYWFQELLKPLHNAMFNWLKGQEQDGTFNQLKAVDWVKGQTAIGKRLWSFDLTAATDRWPIWHQASVIEAMWGRKWMLVWVKLMGISPYSLPHNRWLEYSVGQPMGCYTSWATLAVSHHALIRFCASQVGVGWNCYRVLGDDVVISNEQVATRYQQYLSDLGVTISEAKSMLPDKQVRGISSAEFAKQVIKDGLDLTPVSPALLKEIYDDHQWWKILDLFKILQNRFAEMHIVSSEDGTIWVPTPMVELIAPIKRYEKKIMVLVSDRMGPGCLISEVKLTINMQTHTPYADPWAGVGSLEYLMCKQEMLLARLQEDAHSLIKLRESLGEASGTKLAGLLLEIPSHPIWSVIDRLEKAIKDSCKAIIGHEEVLTNPIELMMDAQFLRDMIVKGTTYREWQDMKSRRLKQSSFLTLKLHHKVTNLEQYY